MEENRIRTSKGELMYLRGGAGPVLLFLHGGIATPHAYLPLLNALANTHTVLAPVHPGHGQSFFISNNWTLADFVVTYKEFLNRLNVTPDILVGHSFGGALALLLAAEHTGKRAIVMDCPGLPFPLSPKNYIQIMVEEAKEVMRQQPDIERVGELAGAAGTLVHTVLLHASDIPWLYRAIPSMDLTEKLSTIPIPVWIVWGEQDFIVPKVVGMKISTIIPNSHLTVFPSYGHNYPVTAHEFTYQELMKILESALFKQEQL